MVGLYKNPSGELIYLSKYHHENIAESHRSMFRGGSVTSSSFISSFDPTSSLRGFFRSVSYTSHGVCQACGNILLYACLSARCQ